MNIDLARLKTIIKITTIYYNYAKLASRTLDATFFKNIPTKLSLGKNGT
jgi:hypothetical protein